MNLHRSVRLRQLPSLIAALLKIYNKRRKEHHTKWKMVKKNSDAVEMSSNGETTIAESAKNITQPSTRTELRRWVGSGKDITH